MCKQTSTEDETNKTILVVIFVYIITVKVTEQKSFMRNYQK